MGHDEFVELVRRMREKQREGGESWGPEGELQASEECRRLEKEVDRAIGLMDGQAYADSWRQAAKEGT